MTLHKSKFALTLFLLGACASRGFADNKPAEPAPAWIARPLSLADAINVALRQNGDILRGKKDMEAQYGLAVQTRAVAIPKVQLNGSYQYSDEIQTIPFPGIGVPNHLWNANIQVTQTIYQGGQINSALRSARLTRQQALLQYQSVIADSLLQVRVAYYDILLAMEQVTVEKASIKLLTDEYEDQKRRYDAGSVPRFNVLQADVQLANERPKLIQAGNALRIDKNNFVNLLGGHLPPQVWADVPLQLTDKLDAEPYEIELPYALAQALENRTELKALRKTEALRKEDVVAARAGYKPTAQIFAGYGAENSQFDTDPGYSVYGTTAGVKVSWNIFDGFLTRGKVAQARSLYQGSQVDVDNETRGIELEVRTDYLNLTEAKAIRESQEKVVEEAEEAVRLATARTEAGTGTQLDLLTAETSLTQARSTRVQALHDYDVARARLERAMGLNILQTPAQ